MYICKLALASLLTIERADSQKCTIKNLRKQVMLFICWILRRFGEHVEPRPAVPASSNVIISSAMSGSTDTMDIEIVGVSKRRRYNCGVAPQTKQDLP